MLVRLLGENRKFEELTRTHTIGLGGCMFVSPESVGYGALMEMLISFRDGVARTDGRVVWERQRSSEEVEVGVEFLRLSATDRRLVSALLPAEEPQATPPIA
jgi:hypothetical protein